MGSVAYNPPIGRKNTTYSPCRTWGVKNATDPTCQTGTRNNHWNNQGPQLITAHLTKNPLRFTIPSNFQVCPGRRKIGRGSQLRKAGVTPGGLGAWANHARNRLTWMPWNLLERKPLNLLTSGCPDILRFVLLRLDLEASNLFGVRHVSNIYDGSIFLTLALAQTTLLSVNERRDWQGKNPLQFHGNLKGPPQRPPPQETRP